MRKDLESKFCKATHLPNLLTYQCQKHNENGFHENAMGFAVVFKQQALEACLGGEFFVFVFFFK